MSPRLTPPQWRLLQRLSDEATVAVKPTGAGRGLYVAGLAEWDDKAGNGLWWLIITPAGRAALNNGKTTG